MRMKDVTRQTGLSEWTIRYYMKEGLVQPEEETRNGRVYSDFSPADVEGLNAVVQLRSARFSLEEIRTMQQTPNRILEVVAAYTQRMQREKVDLHRLNLALEQIDEAPCDNYIQLSQTLKTRYAGLHPGNKPSPDSELVIQWGVCYDSNVQVS